LGGHIGTISTPIIKSPAPKGKPGTMISPTSSAEPITSTSSFAAFVLASMRVAYLRTRIMGNEIATTAVALRSGLIDAETALAMLYENGVAELIPTSS
jgi:hypothetical protein